MSKVRVITDNIIKLGTILGIPLRNFIEAVFFSIIFLIIILIIPFVPKVKLIAAIIVVSVTFIVNARGIKGRSILQFLEQEIKFRKSKTHYHYSPPTYENKEAKLKQSVEGESYAEQWFNSIKKKYFKFLGRNS